jgi:hypothetical protein
VEDSLLSNSYVDAVLLIKGKVMFSMMFIDLCIVCLKSGLEFGKGGQAQSSQVLEHITFALEGAVVHF